VRDFRELKVWEKGHRLTLAVYEATSGFPREELYGLTRQMRRSASSVPTNIAEGCGRDGDAEMARFLRMAGGSASELEYQLLLAHELTLLDDPSYKRLTEEVNEVKRMVRSLVRKLSTSDQKANS
jgi:four helix bundle protein